VEEKIFICVGEITLKWGWPFLWLHKD